MADDITAISWDDVAEEENTVTEDEQNDSEDIGFKKFVGVGRYKCVGCDPNEITWLDYCPFAANLTFSLIEIIEAVMPVLDEKGKPVKKNGEVVARQRSIGEEEKKKLKSTLGFKVSNNTPLHHPDEKPGTKNRRLFIAKAMGIMDKDSRVENNHMWRKAMGKEVILTTEIDRYKNKDGEWVVKGTRVTYSGFKAVDIPEEEDSFDDI